MPGLVGLGVVAVEGDEHVESEAQQLQRDVRRQQLAGRRHQHRGEHGEEQDAVVLARVLQVALHVLHARQHDDDTQRREEDLEDERVTVEDQRAAVEAARLPAPRRQQGRDDPSEAHCGNGREDLLAAVGQEQVCAQHDEGQRGDQELRDQQREVVHPAPAIAPRSLATLSSMPLMNSSGSSPMSRMNAARIQDAMPSTLEMSSGTNLP